MQNNKFNTLIELNYSAKPITNVFCLHSAGGGVEGYKWLSEYFADKYQFYGLEDPCLFDGFHYESMEDLAIYHVKVIKSIQPTGPYIIFGYCSGGPIAHEVCNQLRIIGDNVQSACYFNRKLGWFDPDDDTKFFFLKAYLSGKYNLDFDSINWSLCEEKGWDFLCRSVIDVFKSNSWMVKESDYSWIKKTIISLTLMKSAARNYTAPDADFNIFQFASQKDNDATIDKSWCDIFNHASSYIIDAPPYNEFASNDLMTEPNVRTTINKIEELVLTE